MGYKVFKGDNIEAQLNYQEFRMLEKENPDHNPNAEDQAKFKTTCNPGEYDSCIYAKLRAQMLEEVNCTVPYMKGVETLICTQYAGASVAFRIHW